MYINKSKDFLILLDKNVMTNEPVEYRAVVRKVSLKQFGHFMMGYARVFGYSLVISGPYGIDGLSISVDQKWDKEDKQTALRKLWDSAVPVPDELIKLWNTGGGHNSSGSEAPAMRKWALENLKELKGKKQLTATR